MRTLLATVLTTVLIVGSLLAADPPPYWAYGFASPPPAQPATPAPAAPAAPATPAPPPDPTEHTLPGANIPFTLAQIRDGFGPADWYPTDHPRMPEIVAHGRRPAIRACALCHYPNGKGRPENAGVAGLPVSYFIQTMSDFKNGLRKSADSRKNNTNTMIQFATTMTDDEVRVAAEYFAMMKWTPWIKVVETTTVPKTRIAGGMFIAVPGAENEPIGQRIIEVPEQAERTEMLRDPRSGFIAYVPVGSLKKGEALAAGGNGKAACSVCHGANLNGSGPVPGIAGRSPSYMVRQLYDMQQGFRKGVWTELMAPVVANLSQDDMIAIAAYAASRSSEPAAEKASASGQ